MNCVCSDKKYCRGEARIYITQMIGNSITAAIDIGIRRISFPTKTETRKGIRGIISAYTQYASLTPWQGVSKSILALMSSHAPLRTPYTA